MSTDTFLDDKKSEEQLKEELGAGVEKTPELPEKPVLKVEKLDLSKAMNVSDIIAELTKLPDTKEASKQIDKNDEYQTLGKKIWLIKQAQKDSFEIPLKKIKSKNGNEYMWERDAKRKPVTEPVTFYYSSIAIQEKDKLYRLQLKKQKAYNDITFLSSRLRKAADNKNAEEAEKALKETDLATINDAFYNTNREYYTTGFKAYFGATEEEIARMSVEDLEDYVDVAVQKEGVRDPQSVGL